MLWWKHSLLEMVLRPRRQAAPEAVPLPLPYLYVRSLLPNTSFHQVHKHRTGNGKIRFWKFILGTGILFEPFPTMLVTLGCLTVDWLASATGIYSSLFWRLGRLRPRFQGNLVSWWRLSFCFEEVHVFAVTLYRRERGRKRQPERQCESKHSFVYSYKGTNLILRAPSKLNYLPKPHLQIPSH